MRLNVYLGEGQVRDNGKQLVSSFYVHRAFLCPFYMCLTHPLHYSYETDTTITSILEIRKLGFIKIGQNTGHSTRNLAFGSQIVGSILHIFISLLMYN